jgi:hypothetical protein
LFAKKCRRLVVSQLEHYESENWNLFPMYVIWTRMFADSNMMVLLAVLINVWKYWTIQGYSTYTYFKDAGFVHESFWNETNRIFWDFWSYEMNPRNESFEHRSTKRINETNLLNTVGIRESGSQDSYGFVVRLCSKDLWGFVGFVGFVKKGRILSKNVYETNPWNESLNTIDGFAKRIRIRDVRIRISYETNPNWLATNPHFYEPLIQFPHP